MVHTDTKTYWDPIKPRINIYGFTDSTYSSPLYTYNGFTDAGNVDKPIALSFESQTTTAGTFALEIDDSSDTLDPDMFLRGNRVVIECSKDNSTWQTAFKGLVRSGKQKIFGPDNRTITIQGYSYLLRLSERILSASKQARLLTSGTSAGEFDRTDTSMLTNTLISDMLTNDANYLYTTDDTALYSIFKTANIASSPIDDWIPRVDFDLETLDRGLLNVLEFSTSLVTIDFSNDQLVLFNPDRVPTTGGSNTFLVTDAMNLQADDANYTMYPIADYTYQISYDYPDAGNRLVAAIGNVQCPPIVIPGSGTAVDIMAGWTPAADGFSCFQPAGNCGIGGLMKPMANPITKVRMAGCTLGTVTVPSNQMNVAVYTWNMSAGHGIIPGQIGATFAMAINGVAGTAVPQGSGSGVPSAAYKWETVAGFTFSVPIVARWYWFVAFPTNTISQNASNTLQLAWTPPHYDRYVIIRMSDGALISNRESAGHDPAFKMDQGTNSTPDTIIPPCGGLPNSADADPWLAIGSDCNTSKRIGMVEQTVSNIPIYVKKFQSIQEYLFNKLYVTARPRFNFDYPSVTAPSTMPKAGDLVCHVSKKAQVGRSRTAVQIGVISAINYEFGQDSDSVLGLRKLSVGTTGILRGSY